MTDSFTNIRQIKESGTEIYFEKENIWTFDVKGEQLLIIMNSLPQEEARNISTYGLSQCIWCVQESCIS